jgi:hypothetical protein
MRMLAAALVLATSTVALLVWRFSAGTGDYFTVPVSAYGLSDGPLGRPTLTAFVGWGYNATFSLLTMEEHQDRVVVTIQAKVLRVPSVGVQRTYAFVFTLDKPLGQRLVVDGSTGATVPPDETASRYCPDYAALRPTGGKQPPVFPSECMIQPVTVIVR